MDAEQLRVYFPYQRVLDGMFAIYQRIFGLKFERVEPPYKWIGDLQLYAVSDAEDRRAARVVLPRHVPARRQIQSLRPVRPHRRQAAARRQIPAPDRRADLQFPGADAGQAVAAVASRRRDDLPRVRPRDALDPDPRQVRALLRHERPARFRRGAVADARELGLGQEGAGQLRRRLSRSVEEDPGGDPGQAQGSQARHRRHASTAASSPSA